VSDARTIKAAIDNLARVLDEGLAGLKPPAPGTAPFAVAGDVNTRLPDAGFEVYSPGEATVTIGSDFVAVLIRRVPSQGL